MLVSGEGLDVALMVLAQEEETVVVTVAKYQRHVSVILVHCQFRPGPEVTCVLNQVEKSYSGTCTAEDGLAASMDLSPPKKEGEK